jgi:hypothetical protein
MSMALAEYFREVTSSDVFDYGFGGVSDFLKSKYDGRSFDWVITNPPFRLAEEFIKRSMTIARHGVAMLTRTVFIESVGRFERLFKSNPPMAFAQFVERVPMVKGRIDKTASTATGYGWLVWEKKRTTKTQLIWIPPCRRALEQDGDYQQQVSHATSRRPHAMVVALHKPATGDLFAS